jgi:hypothetical protein
VLGFIFRSHQVFRISGVVIGLFGIAILSSAVDAGEVLASLSLGRRDGVYAPERISNLNFYVVSVVMFVLSVPYAVRWIKRGDVAFPFTSGILAFYLLAVAASFLNEAGTRLVAMANIFAMVHLGAMRGNIRYYAMWMIAVFQILLVGNEFIKGNFGPDSWFFRWVMILS